MDFLIQVPLVLFEREGVVPLLRDNLRGNLGLRSHCINGDKTAFEGELLEQQRDGRYLIRFFFGGQLSQNDAIFDGPGAHQVQRFLARLPIMGTTQRLAIDRDDSFDGSAQPLHPLHKTGLKLLGINEGEDAPKRIVRRDSIGQIKQLRKKRFFGFATFLDLHPPIGSTQHSTNRHNDDIPSSVQLGSFHSRIFHLCKNAFEIS